MAGKLFKMSKGPELVERLASELKIFTDFTAIYHSNKRFYFYIGLVRFFGNVKYKYIFFASSEQTNRTHVDVNLLTPFAWLFSFSNSKSWALKIPSAKRSDTIQNKINNKYVWEVPRQKRKITVASFAFVLRKWTDRKWRSHQGLILTNSMVKNPVIF